MGPTALLIFLALVADISATEIPSFYQTQQEFNDADQVCTESQVGPRAKIYCHGRILQAVMALDLYNDSKTFVDKPLLYKPEQVLANFDELFPTDDNITTDALKEFMDANFGPEGKEMEPCDLLDWTEKPPKLAEIDDPKLQEFALDLNKIWKKLCRQIEKNFTQEMDRHSLIYVPNKFVIPGGRFREYYYWDTYWIIKGLLASGMTDTVKDILSNFISILERHDFIPNGGRIYYLARSQPPFLIQMFYEYLEATGDVEFVLQSLPMLEKEFAFWDRRRSVVVNAGNNTYSMYQYRAESSVPRPESFREDVELVQNFTQEEKKVIWNNLASAAESGNDFSSRWLRGGNLTDLSTIDTVSIVPVDLNAFMCRNMEILAHFYSLKPDGFENETSYRQRHAQFKHDFQKVFYVKSEQGWYDYDLKDGGNNIRFHPQNAIPIFARCYDSLDRWKAEQVYKRFQKFKLEHCPNGVFSCANGIPSSLISSGQQWDAPNAWPPLEHMVIDGMRRSDSAKLQEHAYELTIKWIRTNYLMFKKTGSMFEKYDAATLDKGSGGEYETPIGFGWTNGVVLDLLVTYGSRLNSAEIFVNSSTLAPAHANKTDTVLEIDHYYRYESFSVNNLPCAVAICTMSLFFFIFN